MHNQYTGIMEQHSVSLTRISDMVISSTLGFILWRQQIIVNIVFANLLLYKYGQSFRLKASTFDLYGLFSKLVTYGNKS